MGTLPLRAALKRGGLVTVANWPVVLIDFGVDSLYKLAVAIPVLGGALMVGTLVGTDLRTVVAEGVGPTTDLVLGSLAGSPAALLAFLAALAVTAIGGEALAFIVKAATLAVIVVADRDAGELQDEAFDADALLQRAGRFGLAAVIQGAQRFARRAVWLAVGLGAIYCVLGLAYVGVVTSGLHATAGARWTPAWPVLVLLATSAGIVAVTAANLAYDLLRVVIVTDDCSIRTALDRLRHFVIEDARQVIGIFSVIGGIELVAGAASILATAGLAPMAYLPFVGLVMVPLQAALWLLRGLVFQGMTLASLAAYQTQYRRFSRARWPVA
jgi:hypothetical protein